MVLSNRQRGRDVLQHAALYLADTYDIREPIGWGDERFPIRVAAELLVHLEAIVGYGKEESTICLKP